MDDFMGFEPDMNSDSLGVSPEPLPSEDWDKLETELPSGGDEFVDDREDRLADEEALDALLAELPEWTAAQEQAATAEEIYPQVVDRLQQADMMEAYMTQNPAAVAEMLISNMPPHEKAMLLNRLGMGYGNASQFDPNAYEPQGEMEQALKSRWNDLNAIPEVSRQVSGLGQQFGLYRQVIEPQVAYANVAAQVQAARIDAICEALGLDIPEPDMNQIEAALQQQGITYRDAVRRSANYSKQVELSKQSRRPRPMTPGNQTRWAEAIAPGTNMLDIARQLDPNFGR